MSNVDSAIKETTERLSDAVDDLKAKGRETIAHTNDLLTSVRTTVDDSLRTRPYTTLALAGVAGFLYAVLRRR